MLWKKIRGRTNVFKEQEKLFWETTFKKRPYKNRWKLTKWRGHRKKWVDQSSVSGRKDFLSPLRPQGWTCRSENTERLRLVSGDLHGGSFQYVRGGMRRHSGFESQVKGFDRYPKNIRKDFNGFKQDIHMIKLRFLERILAAVWNFSGLGMEGGRCGDKSESRPVRQMFSMESHVSNDGILDPRNSQRQTGGCSQDILAINDCSLVPQK